MTPRRENRLGMTLIEMLAYTVVSAALLNICAVTFVQTTRLASLSTARAVRQQAMVQFSRDVVRTVHGASRVLPNAGSAVTGDNQVVLETPGGPAVIGMAGTKPAIWKLETVDGAWRIARITAYPLDATVRFAWDARHVTVHVTGPPHKDPGDTSNQRTIAAAFRVGGAAP